MRTQKTSFPFLRIMRVIPAAVLLLTIVIGPVAVSAAETEDELNTEPYTYTVRILSGVRGSMTGGSSSANGVSGVVSNGGKALVYSGLEEGDSITFSRGSVSLSAEDEKYYVKDIREGGKDNYDAEHPQLSVIRVTQDADYVVVYGIKGETVRCTVRYVDTNGNPLTRDSKGNAVQASEVFYGNVGDTPVVGAHYIDGYFPDAYNKTKANGLSANENENVFTFTYQRIPTPTPVPAATVTPVPAATVTPAASTSGSVVRPAQPVTSGMGGLNSTGTSPAPGMPGTESTEESGDNGAAEGTEPAGNRRPGTTGLPSSPDEVPEIIDIDEEDVPLAGGVNMTGASNMTNTIGIGENATGAGTGNDTNTTGVRIDTPSGLSKGTIAGIIAAVVAAVAVIIVAVRHLIAIRRQEEVLAGLTDKDSQKKS